MARGTVLVVDTDRGIADLLRMALEDEGYSVLVVTDPTISKIERTLQQEAVDCVLLGGESPSAYGQSWIWAAGLSQRSPPLPTVMFTADGHAVQEAQQRASARAQAAAFVAIVTNPFSLEELLAAVADAVEHAPPRRPTANPPDVMGNGQSG